MAYQLLLWREGYIPEEKPSAITQSEAPVSRDAFKCFLNQIDKELLEWIKILPGFENNKNTVIAENFIQEKSIKYRLPRILGQMGFKKNHQDKFSQYDLYYRKIKKHIIRKINWYKKKCSQENELKKLATDSVLSQIPQIVEEILKSKSNINKKREQLITLIHALGEGKSD